VNQRFPVGGLIGSPPRRKSKKKLAFRAVARHYGLTRLLALLV
jgi:hypothetical protein